MEILVNGNREVIESDELSLIDLLTKYEIKEGQRGVAVAVNFSVVPRTLWKETILKEADEVEIIRATAGG